MFDQLWNRLQSRLRRRNLDDEMDDEIRFHLEMQIETNVAAGMTPKEARRVALRDFGGATQVKEACRDARHTWLDSVWQDIRYAFRSFRRDRAFTITAILTLAIGIGATTSTYSIVDGILFRPLPYPDADRVVMFMGRSPGRDLSEGLKQEDFTALHGARSFEAVAAYSAFLLDWLTMVGAGPAQRLRTTTVSSDFFSVLGVHPFLGRQFTPEDADEQAGILTYGLWQRRFGGDRAVVGRTISFQEHPVTVVGIMPPDFWYPRTTAKGAPELLLSGHVEWDKPLAENEVYFLVGRLHKGVSLKEAQAEADVIAGRVHSRTARRYGILVTPLRTQMVVFQRKPLLIMFGAVLFLLLIACVNVANLMLTRGRQREREFAIRGSLGAGRGRIIRQLLTEAILLACIGGAIGMLLSYCTLDIVVARVPGWFRVTGDIGIDHRVLAFSVVLILGSVILFGWIPALQLSNRDLITSLKIRARERRAPTRRTGKVLLVSETALVLVLLMNAGLLINSFVRLRSVDLGFDTTNIVAAGAYLTPQRYPSDERVTAFFQEAVERLNRVPGVRSACFAEIAPINGASMKAPTRVEASPDEQRLETYRVQRDYFQTLGIPVLEGRVFERYDERRRPAVAVVNETMARRYWGKSDPIGRRLVVWKDTPVQIIGVVRDIRNGFRDSRSGLRASPEPTIYVPYDSSYRRSRARDFIIRTSPGRTDLTEAIKAAITADDHDLVVSPRSLDDRVEGEVADPRFYALVVGLFAVIGLLLSAVGIAGVAAHDVLRRTHEIGVRMALGASAGRVVGAITTQVTLPIAIGLALGIAAAVALTRVLASLLFEIKPRDPVTFAVVSMLLAAVALVATWLPARRAARVDPIEVLRAE